MKTASSATTYLLQGGAKRAFTDLSVFNSWGRSIDEIVTIGDAEMAAYSAGAEVPVRDGTLIKGSDPTVYVVEGGSGAPLCWPPTSRRLAIVGKTYRPIPDAVLNQIPSGVRMHPIPWSITTGLTVTPDWPAVGSPLRPPSQ